MTWSLAHDARLLGGRVSGGEIVAPGPGHSKVDLSLCLRPCPNAPNGTGYLIYSFAGDDQIECLDYVRNKLGYPPFGQDEPQSPQYRAERPKHFVKPIDNEFDYAQHELYQEVSNPPPGTCDEYPPGFDEWPPDQRNEWFRLQCVKWRQAAEALNGKR